MKTAKDLYRWETNLHIKLAQLMEISIAKARHITSTNQVHLSKAWTDNYSGEDAAMYIYSKSN